MKQMTFEDEADEADEADDLQDKLARIC